MAGYKGDVRVFLNIFNGRGGLSDEELELCMPDIQEAKSLPTHIKRCGQRFRLVAGRLSDQNKDLQQVKFILLGIGGYLVIVSEPARNVIGMALKYLGG
jgi:hypothetical protein